MLDIKKIKLQVGGERAKILGIVILGLITLVIGDDGKHYWHDIRFAYAATNFSMEAILDGSFNPHQIPGPIKEISAGGFYLAKFLHLWTFQVLFKFIPPAHGGFVVASWMSALFLGLAIWFGYFVFLKLLESRDQT